MLLQIWYFQIPVSTILFPENFDYKNIIQFDNADIFQSCTLEIICTVTVTYPGSAFSAQLLQYIRLGSSDTQLSGSISVKQLSHNCNTLYLQQYLHLSTKTRLKPYNFTFSTAKKDWTKTITVNHITYIQLDVKYTIPQPDEINIHNNQNTFSFTSGTIVITQVLAEHEWTMQYMHTAEGSCLYLEVHEYRQLLTALNI